MQDQNARYSTYFKLLKSAAFEKFFIILTYLETDKYFKKLNTLQFIELTVLVNNSCKVFLHQYVKDLNLVKG